MKRNNAGERTKWTVLLAAVCLAAVTAVLVGCFEEGGRLPSLKLAKIPELSAAKSMRGTYTALGYGKVKTVEGQSLLGWWRINHADNAYHRHGVPKTESGLPTGLERTVQIVPVEEVVKFQPN